MYQHEKMDGMTMKSYQMQQLLGQGTSAKVYRALDTDTSKQVAVKVIPKQYLNSDPKMMQLVKTQISILKSCNNYNVIKCHDVFQSQNSIFIVTQLCNGLDMEKYLDEKKYLPEDKAVMFLKQILNGFQGLHNLGVMHRDFKLANVLLNDEVCKIADLGYAKKLDRDEITYTLLGTRITMAPEVLQGNGYTFSADIWSLGVVFYQMLFGKYPYSGINQKDFLRKIKTKPIDFTSMRISNQAKNFIERCLTYDPTKRITWYQIYSHPLINKKSMELIYGIFNPVHRMEENQQFYQQNEKELQNPQNFSLCEILSIMRSTIRKKIIMQEIQYIVERKTQKSGKQKDIVLEHKQKQNILLNYSNKYLMYFNKLSFPLKFLRLQLLQNTIITEKNMQIETFIYLIFKKCLYQLRQFDKVLNNKINIFKINLFWHQFNRSMYYREVKETVQYNIKKVELIIKELQQYACFSAVAEIKNEALYGLLSHQQITELCEKYQIIVAKNLLNYFKQDRTKNENFIEFMQGLMYYLIKDERQKISPQQFDTLIARPFDIEKIHRDLVERYEIFFEHL